MNLFDVNLLLALVSSAPVSSVPVSSAPVSISDLPIEGTCASNDG